MIPWKIRGVNYWRCILLYLLRLRIFREFCLLQKRSYYFLLDQKTCPSRSTSCFTPLTTTHSLPFPSWSLIAYARSFGYAKQCFAHKTYDANSKDW